MSELTTTDYKHILEFYNNPIPKSKNVLKNQAENLLANKLCRCIKKFKNEGRAIGICTKTVIKNKGFNRNKFTCKKNKSIQLSKTIKNRRYI
jgi:hypothetical protein